jgi:hypothetical protein
LQHTLAGKPGDRDEVAEGSGVEHDLRRKHFGQIGGSAWASSLTSPAVEACTKARRTSGLSSKAQDHSSPQPDGRSPSAHQADSAA